MNDDRTLEQRCAQDDTHCFSCGTKLEHVPLELPFAYPASVSHCPNQKCPRNCDVTRVFARPRPR